MLETIIPTCAPRPRSLSTVANDAAFAHDEPRLPANDWGIIGRSHALRTALRAVQQVAGADATVLVTGESGTGKELIANAVHKASSRRERAFVKVNCAAMPANLIESELFGHERGAFTGATLKREGRFALADGGTLFLDEIGELPLELQAKLLRVLQEGEFEPLGSSRTRYVDVRVVAATNRDLAQEVQAGRFREDLYFRLNVFPVQLPPLRERTEDIPLLVAAFLERLRVRLGRTFQAPSRESIRQLQAYPWPGNVRELHNIVERAVIRAEDGYLDFARALPEQPALKPLLTSTAEVRATRVLTARELEEIERANYLLALELCNWQVSGDSGAARLLGIKASTLTSRLKALGLHRVRTLPPREPTAPRHPSTREVTQYA
jgi:transcriptional regulator with GAF, ATPase, and Fis domain